MSIQELDLELQQGSGTSPGPGASCRSRKKSLDQGCFSPDCLILFCQVSLKIKVKFSQFEPRSRKKNIKPTEINRSLQCASIVCFSLMLFSPVAPYRAGTRYTVAVSGMFEGGESLPLAGEEKTTLSDAPDPPPLNAFGKPRTPSRCGGDTPTFWRRQLDWNQSESLSLAQICPKDHRGSAPNLQLCAVTQLCRPDLAALAATLALAWLLQCEFPS